jgi:GDP-L-fucose synthase
MKRVLLTGASGFIGRHLAEALSATGVHGLVRVQRGLDLRNREQARSAFRDAGRVDYVIHAADVSGDPRWAAANAGTQFISNTAMVLNTLEAWRDLQPDARFVSFSSLWAYPEHVVDVVEDEYWSGRMHVATEHYGMSKKLLGVGIQAMRREHGLRGTVLVLGNVYGPGDTSSRVIPSLIRRMQGDPDVLEVWGDGSETRDFIYIDDQTAAIIQHLDYDGDLLNVSTGTQHSIRDVVTTLARITNYAGRIVFAPEKAGGVARRRVSVARATAATGWPSNHTLHSLEDGLRKTVGSAALAER